MIYWGPIRSIYRVHEGHRRKTSDKEIILIPLTIIPTHRWIVRAVVPLLFGVWYMWQQRDIEQERWANGAQVLMVMVVLNLVDFSPFSGVGGWRWQVKRQLRVKRERKMVHKKGQNNHCGVPGKWPRFDNDTRKILAFAVGTSKYHVVWYS